MRAGFLSLSADFRHGCLVVVFERKGKRKKRNLERANAAEGGFMADLWKEVIAAEGRLQSSSGDVAFS